MRLTAAGETVLEHACKIVGAEETLLSELANMPVSGGARIRVVDMMHANTLYIGLNEAVEEAKESFPDLRVEYVSMEPSGLNAQQLVDAGKADIAFETTMSTEMPPATRSMDGFLAILIPEFHGEFVVGVPKGSKLAEKENLVLADLAGERFILPANRSGEIFRRNFIEACRKAGFYPNISLVPMDNAFMFYGSEPHDAVHLLVRVDRKYKPLIADLVKQHTVIKSFVDEKRYIDPFAVVDPRCEDPALFAYHRFPHRASRRLRGGCRAVMRNGRAWWRSGGSGTSGVVRPGVGSRRVGAPKAGRRIAFGGQSRACDPLA